MNGGAHIDSEALEPSSVPGLLAVPGSAVLGSATPRSGPESCDGRWYAPQRAEAAISAPISVSMIDDAVGTLAHAQIAGYAPRKIWVGMVILDTGLT